MSKRGVSFICFLAKPSFEEGAHVGHGAMIHGPLGTKLHDWHECGCPDGAVSESIVGALALVKSKAKLNAVRLCLENPSKAR